MNQDDATEEQILAHKLCIAEQKLEKTIRALKYYVETQDESKYIAISSNFKSNDVAKDCLKEIGEL